ncbi:radical SAM (seleno)protein TrsS [Clostridiisalibacter paucivorans]|uniref:radical SAM (seleno)protein TrsS n=1 Tax=Clostridiisalibacter paucivorans TaxID=408753 RepID=UPI000AEBF4C8|nr:radical SAM (seleno)protein TrsS [Clostridiisalibacter paucivorans]
MMEKYGEMIFKTESLCPICLKKIPAYRVKEDQRIYLEKECKEHGKFKTLIWNGIPDMDTWIRKKIPSKPKKSFKKIDKGCPFDCGLCDDHRQHTCTALIEVTERCNLECNFCFASSTKDLSEDPNLDKIKFWYKRVLEAGGPYNIQISGGEPTVRDDLDKIIKMGHDLGFEFIQLNTNGIRIGQDENYVKKLKESGLDSVFLQFDGTKEYIYKKLRGKGLFEIKIKAIENLNKYNIGIILVPTIVPGVNMSNIGEIIDFAIEHIPVIRGVHFQPVSYFGRFPSESSENIRITIPDIIREIEIQTNGRIKMESFKAPGCENSLCSFNGNYIYRGKKILESISNKSCCSKVERAEIGSQKARNFVSRNWRLPNKRCRCSEDNFHEVTTFDDILDKLKTFNFSISGMAFQDVWNIDLDRLKDCCIHVVSNDGNLIPFCAYNLTDSDGNYLYRGKS